MSWGFTSPIRLPAGSRNIAIDTLPSGTSIVGMAVVRPSDSMRFSGEIVHGDVERRVARPARHGRADAAVDARAGAGVDEPVVHRIVGVDLPAERVGVELP